MRVFNKSVSRSNFWRRRLPAFLSEILTKRGLPEISGRDRNSAFQTGRRASRKRFSGSRFAGVYLVALKAKKVLTAKLKL